MPKLSSDIEKAEDLDKEIKASGFGNEGLAAEDQ